MGALHTLSGLVITFIIYLLCARIRRRGRARSLPTTQLNSVLKVMGNGAGKQSRAIGSSEWLPRSTRAGRKCHHQNHRHPGKAESLFAVNSFLFVLSKLSSMPGSDANRSMSSAYIIY